MQGPFSMIKRLLQIYSLLVALWFLCNRLLQDSWWGLVVLDKFAEYFLFASIPVFLLSLLFRNKLTILTAVLPLAACAFFYLPFFFKIQSPKIPAESDFLRVGTFNLWNHNKDIEGVVELLNKGNADVISVQEITEVQRPELVELLSQTYPHYHVSREVYGGTTALFSRHSLMNLSELEFNIDRPAIVADIEWQGQTVSVVSAHLNPSFWAYHQKPLREIPRNYHQYIKDQNTQASMIIDNLRSRNDSSAYFLACDCNSQEAASTNRLLGMFFKDTFKSVGWQLGNPHESHLSYERNLRHIDYVWYAGDVEVHAIYRAKESVNSDHQPIYADFSFAE